MKTSGIYRIDLGNDWFYIGSSVDLKKRNSEHYRRLKRQSHENYKMQNIWNKYQLLDFIILEQCTKHELLNREQFYLDQYFDNPKNVNICSTAQSWLGNVHSAETKAKISATSKGRIPSVSTRAKMSAAGKGKPKSAETRIKMSKAAKGKIKSIEHRANLSASCKKKKLSVEHRAKISEAIKGKKHSPETKAKISEGNKAYRARKYAAKILSI
jgi:group I intron endonuclease